MNPTQQVKKNSVQVTTPHQQTQPHSKTMTSLITQPPAQKFSIAVPLQALETVLEVLGKSIKQETKEELLVRKSFRRMLSMASTSSMLDIKTGIPLFPLIKPSKRFVIMKSFLFQIFCYSLFLVEMKWNFINCICIVYMDKRPCLKKLV